MPPRVLVVDDEAPLCEVIAAVLEEAGYAVAQAHTGYAALQQLIRQPPQLILLDMRMPAMSGTQFYAALARTAFTIPVVFMSAVPRAEAEPLGHRAAGYLRKPFALPLLLQTVQQLLPLALPGDPCQTSQHDA
jgi:CheY-like chemotaxis protein